MGQRLPLPVPLAESIPPTRLGCPTSVPTSGARCLHRATLLSPQFPSSLPCPAEPGATLCAHPCPEEAPQKHAVSALYSWPLLPQRSGPSNSSQGCTLLRCLLHPTAHS